MAPLSGWKRFLRRWLLVFVVATCRRVAGKEIALLVRRSRKKPPPAFSCTALLLLLAPSKEEPPGILANNNFLPLLALALPLALFQVRAAELPHGLVGFL